MKLLIITQKVDRGDDVLGFFYRWLEELAKHCDKVSVISLSAGDYEDLPKNISVFSLGKPASRFLYIVRLFKYLAKLDREYDFVLVHMNPMYLVLAGWWFRLRGKKAALWYTHRQVDLKLRIAEKFVDVIFSAAPESFRLKSKKVQFVGHGIDLDKFICSRCPEERKKTIIHVGRITPIKNCDILIEAFAKLRAQSNFSSFKLVFIGQPVTNQDQGYFGGLKKIIRDLKLEEAVIFNGSVPHNQIAEWYCQVAASVNLTPTGGIDKAVLESMASSTPAFVSNEAFCNYFGDLASRFIFKYRDADDLANKIQNWFNSPDQKNASTQLTKIAKERAGVDKLISVLVEKIASLK